MTHESNHELFKKFSFPSITIDGIEEAEGEADEDDEVVAEALLRRLLIR